MLSVMRTIDLIPTRDDRGGVRTHVGGKLQYYFATVDDLRIKLWNSCISPEHYRKHMVALRRGNATSIPVTEAQWKAFYRQRPADEMEAFEVSPDVGNVKNNSPELLNSK